jgi:GAF domain-containing protein
LHEGRSSSVADPGVHYALDDLGFAAVFAGEPVLFTDVAVDARLDARPDVREWLLAAGIRARLAMPLPSAGRIVGALPVARRAPGEFAPDHVEAAIRLGELIGPLVESTAAFQHERRRRRRLAALAGLTRVLGTSLDAEESSSAWPTRCGPCSTST